MVRHARRPRPPVARGEAAGRARPDAGRGRGAGVAPAGRHARPPRHGPHPHGLHGAGPHAADPRRPGRRTRGATQAPTSSATAPTPPPGWWSWRRPPGIRGSHGRTRELGVANFGVVEGVAPVAQDPASASPACGELAQRTGRLRPHRPRLLHRALRLGGAGAGGAPRRDRRRRSLRTLPRGRGLAGVSSGARTPKPPPAPPTAAAKPASSATGSRRFARPDTPSSAHPGESRDPADRSQLFVDHRLAHMGPGFRRDERRW